MKEVDIYTDGACRGNPGPGGWGVILKNKSATKELYGGDLDTTNNKMELLAAIKGLQSLTQPCKVRLYTDSNYVKQGITEWIINWKRNGFKNAKKKPVLNADLWLELDQLTTIHDIEWFWIKGHSGHTENERADALANKGVDEIIMNR
jgi:ribonuclease HI